jgi:hypothetical protein
MYKFRQRGKFAERIREVERDRKVEQSRRMLFAAGGDRESEGERGRERPWTGKSQLTTINSQERDSR